MERLRSLARGYALEALVAALAVESTVEVALRHEGQRPAWLTAPGIALVILPLLGRRRCPFSAAAASWLIAAAVSFIDGRLVVTPVSAFIAAMIVVIPRGASVGSTNHTASAKAA